MSSSRSASSLFASLLAFAGVAALVACASSTAAPTSTPTATANVRAAAPEAPSKAAPPPLLEEGASVEAAVLVPAADEQAGVDWENDWIYRHYGRFRKKTVALASREGRRYDVITVELGDHTERVFYFDITDFYGKRSREK